MAQPDISQILAALGKTGRAYLSTRYQLLTSAASPDAAKWHAASTYTAACRPSDTAAAGLSARHHECATSRDVPTAAVEHRQHRPERHQAGQQRLGQHRGCHCEGAQHCREPWSRILRLETSIG